MVLEGPDLARLHRARAEEVEDRLLNLAVHHPAPRRRLRDRAARPGRGRRSISSVLTQRSGSARKRSARRCRRGSAGAPRTSVRAPRSRRARRRCAPGAVDPGPRLTASSPARGEIGHVRPGLLRLDRESTGVAQARRAAASEPRRAPPGSGGGSWLPPDELAQPRLCLLACPVGGVAEVERALDAPRNHVRGVPAVADLGHAQHLAEDEPLRPRRRCGSSASIGASPSRRERDRVDAEPGPRRVGRPALERRPRR